MCAEDGGGGGNHGGGDGNGNYGGGGVRDEIGHSSAVVHTCSMRCLGHLQRQLLQRGVARRHGRHGSAVP